MGKKSRLARSLEYWTRQTRRIIILLIGIFILILVIFALAWIIPKLIDMILGI